MHLFHIKVNQIPCLIWISDEWSESDMLKHHTGSNLVFTFPKVVLTLIKREASGTMRYLYLWPDRVCIGCDSVRILQRAWRRYRGERRILAVCMAEDGLLARIVSTLCVDDLRKMILNGF